MITPGTEHPASGIGAPALSCLPSAATRAAEAACDPSTIGGSGRELVVRARRLAHRLLEAGRPERWQHTEIVATQAVRVAITVDEADRAFLVAAAWLHDIGYSPIVATTGFHQVDGALYLADQGWDERLAALVAHHSGARFLPAPTVVADLMSRFPFEYTPVSDALTYADQTVGPHGRRMSVPERVAEAIARHGPGSPIARAGVVRIPYLLAVAVRVEDRLTRTPQ
jgi:hypothetical protein